MKSVLVTILIIYIVPVALNVITRYANHKTEDSINDFCMRPADALGVLGIICTTVFLLIVILAIKADQFNGFTAAGGIAVLMLGVLLILAPVKNFWETSVHGDIITSHRFWIINDSIRISDVEYCSCGRGGISIYEKEHKKRSMKIDSMCTNVDLFIERMEKEGIEIRNAR